MITTASDRYTRRPRPSVSHPSSNACRNRFSSSGLAFSISSSSTTVQGLSRSWFVSKPPRSLPTMPRGMPISLSTDTAPSWYSDMSMRIIFFSSPKRNSATALASSVLPTPVGPRNSSTPSGRSKPPLSGPLFRTSRRASARTACSWPTTRRARRASRSWKRSPTSRNTMSSGMRAASETTWTTSLAVTSQRRSISARTAAVSSQPIALSGRCRCRS